MKLRTAHLDFNLKHQFIAANELVTHLMGYKTVDEIIGTSVYDTPCQAVECAPQFIVQNDWVINNQKPITILDIHPYADGKIWIFLTSKTPLLDKMNRVCGVSCHAVALNEQWVNVLLKSLLFYDLNKKNKQSIRQKSYTLDCEYKNIHLTNREKECLFLLLRGKTGKEIARCLSLSPETVNTYLDRLRQKMNCQKKSELIEKAYELGLLKFLPSQWLGSNISVIVE